MREFFKTILAELNTLTGVRQLEFTSEQELTLLLDSLCVISEKNFGYIPVQVQQREIRRQIIEDPDFNGFNARVLYKWLMRISDKHWRTRYPEEKQPTAEPGPISEETLKMIREFQQGLLPSSVKKVPAATDRELLAIKTEDAQRTEKPRSVAVEYRQQNPLSAEQLAIKEIHHRYLRAKWNYDQDPANAGQPFPDEDLWIELNN